ncbi:transcriptional repressor LexA [Acetobacterium wieringae]|uniref:LexA repressor n=1 Tax=Acetobacterium wieringae TaxID=52694 RepID=A0A1F2PG71_9FIRM|nr:MULTISPECIES: transcriptional repressor LexA [Acetobacterium]HAZ06242.1 transcriptional repressor LexA [Acetobacterium sp.]MEA4804904.1 transcriptional repressor LexA [Acetobacterium wieringae]OFV70349.1 LexA repressor [Acetobacterium wieringae]TYC85386.1 transcriptional repressor LexA [Acetobacterium wieringae]URN85989.1 transcriptional repressor LexA [Acetobacterium wieringae]
MYEDLNSKQLDILKFIETQMRDKRYPPSVREICAAVNLKSTSTAHTYLKKLEELGYIKRDSTKTRAIEVLRHDPNETISSHFDEKTIISLPILGCVTAGAPILAIENITDIFPLPLDFTGSDDAFILIVKGTSMIEAGILDGDKIIVRKQETARNNDIVVALLLEDNEATVKRIFYDEPNKIRLQPENKTMDPIFCNAQDIKILGKVTGLIRKF